MRGPDFRVDANAKKDYMIRLNMNLPAARYVRETAVMLVCAVVFAGAPVGLRAGDAIVFGSDKIKTEPGKDKTPVQNPLRLDKMSSPNQFELDGIIPPILHRINSNPRKEKRQQNAEDEKKNWLLFDRGDLQSKEDYKNFLGVRDEDLEDLDNSKNSRDYTFRESDSSRTPAQLRAPGQSQSHLPGQHRKNEPAPPPQRDEADDAADSKRATARSSAIVFGNAEANTGRAIDLKSLLESKSQEKSDASMRGLFGTMDAPANRDQQARSETFRQLLNGPSSSGGFSDPLNLRSDFARQPANPSAPYSFGESPRKSPGSESFTLTPIVSQPSSSLGYLGSPDRQGQGSAFGPAAPASSGWKSTPVDWPKPRF